MYAVERIATGFLVRHYHAIDDPRMCCRPVSVTPGAGETEIQVLERAYRLLERQHAPQKAIA